MAFLFRSFKMILISLNPQPTTSDYHCGGDGFYWNSVETLYHTGIQYCFWNFSRRYIHFLANTVKNSLLTDGKINKAVFAALRETGISMFYTSVVLFFGFSIFMSSNFGGTQALGGLVAVTLMMAMLANLVLLPSLLHIVGRLHK